MIESSAHARLNAARMSTLEGRYEEALREFVWFHEQALKEQPALYGVRLSFALGYWIDLAEVYPPARTALEAIRDRKTGVLRVGVGSAPLFADVAAINEYLKCEEETYVLFSELARLHPALAQRCAKSALSAIVKAGDFALARRFSPDPEDEVRALSKYLNDEINRRRQSRYTSAPRIKTQIHINAARIKEILAVLDGCGEKAESARLKSLACTLIRATTIREAVRAALVPNARPWFEKGIPPLRVRPRPPVNP